MSEEVMNVTTEEVQKEPWSKRTLANLKERFRKFLVTTKRKPQRLAFFPLLIATFLWMIGIVYFGQVTIYVDVPAMGLCVFINTMFSILTLLLFMNAFPKRGKQCNYIMLALTFVFIAVIITCDLVWYIKCEPEHISAYNEAVSKNDISALKKIEPGLKAFPVMITHLVFVCIGAVLLATMPIYKKWLLKINTSKVIEENKLSEEIDTSAEV